MKGYIYPFKLKKKLEAVKRKFDFIILDSSPTLNDEILATMIAADELLCVTSPDFPTLSTTINAVKSAKNRKTPIRGIIVNKVRNKYFELNPDDIEKHAEAPVLAVLPEDINVLEALSQAKPAAELTPMTNAVIEYRKLAAAMVGMDYEDPRFVEKIKKMFRKDIPKDEINRVLLSKGFI